MSSPSATDLVGRRIRGSIGEPWDFRSAAGRGAIEGTIFAAYQTGDDWWLLCNVSPFEKDGRTITTVLPVERYMKDEPLPTLAQGAAVGVNLLYDPSGEPLTVERVPAFLAAPEKRTFLIGSIELV